MKEEKVFEDDLCGKERKEKVVKEEIGKENTRGRGEAIEKSRGCRVIL
ncbi:MAG TPA: hypothetical protein VN414_00065 [Methanosarcina sp.]|nr:hypothetical protein [Methanosarcina sp.]